MKLSKQTKSALAGALAGSVNGFFSTGGGMLLVPLLRRWAGLEDKESMATAMAVIAPLCLVSAGLYWWRGELELAVAWPYLVGGLAGGTLGGLWFKKLPSKWLRRAFALFLLYGGGRFLFS